MDPISAILGIANTILGRVLPDKQAQAQAQAALTQMVVTGEIANQAGQLQVNIAEAGSKSTFVAGWRPFVGWVCGVAFAYVYILQPFAILILKAAHSALDPKVLPSVDLSDMMPVLLGMLGLGVMRSYDKSQGVGNGH